MLLKRRSRSRAAFSLSPVLCVLSVAINSPIIPRVIFCIARSRSSRNASEGSNLIPYPNFTSKCARVPAESAGQHPLSITGSCASSLARPRFFSFAARR